MHEGSQESLFSVDRAPDLVRLIERLSLNPDSRTGRCSGDNAELMIMSHCMNRHRTKNGDRGGGQ